MVIQDPNYLTNVPWLTKKKKTEVKLQISEKFQSHQISEEVPSKHKLLIMNKIQQLCKKNVKFPCRRNGWLNLSAQFISNKTYLWGEKQLEYKPLLTTMCTLNSITTVFSLWTRVYREVWLLPDIIHHLPSNCKARTCSMN